MESAVKHNLPRLVYVCLICTLVLSMLKIYDAIDITWLIIFIPLLLSISLIIPFAQIQIYETQEKIHEPAFELIMADLYVSVFSLIFFIILTCLRRENSIEWQWYYVFIPGWVSMLAFTALAIFMVPGLMHYSVKLKREGKTLIVVMLFSLGSSILIAMWLNNDFEHLWIALAPLELALIGGFIVCFKEKVRRKRNKLHIMDKEVRAYITIIPVVAFAIVRDLSEDSIPEFALFIAPLMYLALVWVEHETGIFTNFENEEESEEELVKELDEDND
jgi:hypothetical protein